MPNYTITSDKGEFDLVGLPVELEYVGTYDLECDVGSFDLTGQDVDLEYAGTYLLEAVTGAFDLTGQDATLTVWIPSSITAAVGTFELNKESVGFGSFVSVVPLTKLYVTETDGKFISSSGAYVSLDILEGASFSRNMNPLYNHTRVAIVENLNADDDMDTAEINLEALYAVMELTGDIGSRSESIGVPNFIEKFMPEMLDQHTVKVKIFYKSYPLPEYEFDASLGHIETNVDQDGNAIETRYTYPDDYKIDSRKAGLTIVQGGLVSMPISETVITIHFSITAGYLPTLVVDGVIVSVPGFSSATTILTTLQKFNGKVNDPAFVIGNLSCAVRTVIVERVKGRSRDGGKTYQASWTIRYKPQGIEQSATFINSDDGHPPADLVAGDGYYVPEVVGTCEIPSFLFNNPNYWLYGDTWTWE